MNETTSLQGKLGGSSVANSSRNFPSKFIEHTGTIELVYSGNPYTWCNNRFRGQFIKKRLDQAVVKKECLFQFPSVQVRHLTINNSYHRPILLDPWVQNVKANKPFLVLCSRLVKRALLQAHN